MELSQVYIPDTGDRSDKNLEELFFHEIEKLAILGTRRRTVNDFRMIFGFNFLLSPYNQKTNIKITVKHP